MAMQRRSWKRYTPLAIIALLMVAAHFLGLGEYLSLEHLKDHRQALQRVVHDNSIVAPLLYMVIYAVAVALSVPGAVWLTLLGGFLFPQPWATLYVVIAATSGAICIFLAAKTALGDALRSRAGGIIDKMRAGFQEDAVSYLFFLRLVPVFPFWIVNLAPAFFGVSLFTFAWTTFLGIIPGTFVFVQAGAGLGAILDSGDKLSVGTILNNDVKIALVALGLFALLPIVVKRFRKK